MTPLPKLRKWNGKWWNKKSIYALLGTKWTIVNNQSGNKMRHSTETSLIYTTDKILGAIDQKKTTAIVLLDMSKAFDRISHKTLLYKL